MVNYTTGTLMEDIELIKLGLYSIKFDDTLDDNKRWTLIKNMGSVFEYVRDFLWDRAIVINNKRLRKNLLETIETIMKGFAHMAHSTNYNDVLFNIADDIIQLLGYIELFIERIEKYEQKRLQS